MTFHIPAQQAAFKFTLSDGLPLATVEKWGNGYWVTVCPLCGYIHNLPANVRVDAISSMATHGTPWKPNCAIAKQCHRKHYHGWIDKHPRATEFDSIRLILRNRQPIPLDTPAQPVKQPYIAAGKAA
jgi:hypothetical protein